MNIVLAISQFAGIMLAGAGIAVLGCRVHDRAER